MTSNWTKPIANWSAPKAWSSTKPGASAIWNSTCANHPNVSHSSRDIMPRIMKRYRGAYQPRAHLSPAIRPKLKPADVREIRKIYRLADKEAKARGSTKARPGLAQDLATRFGVSVHTIAQIRKGGRWSTLR